VLDEEGCRIQVQQDIVTVSQGDRVILKGEKRGGLYKLKEGNSTRGGVSRITLEGSSSRGGVSKKTATGREPGQSVAGKRREIVQAMTINQPKAPGRGRIKGFTTRLQPRKESRY